MNSINNISLSSNTPISITEKLAAFAAVKDERGTEGSGSEPFAFDSYEQMERAISYRTLLRGSSHHHGFSLHKCLKRGHYIITWNHILLTHESSAEVLGVAGFDVPSQNSVMHQMQMPGNHPPHFPRGFPVAHNGNQGTGLIQDMNQMQGFPLSRLTKHRQPWGANARQPSGGFPKANRNGAASKLKANPPSRSKS
ncbi:hypothetical protein DH2020_025447 [Rehmannia glutinosa]|uniref:Uncharacterized protein n=1 Tax=Rehmannia glutinosa TaxID=99300 RepID=A0ABR0W3L4_REHGL